jgi:crossover junction endodeoxyribonuclease RuvC
MRILGVDPGLATVGWGVIDVINGKPKVVSYGVILTPKEDSLPKRLSIIETDLKLIISKFNPDEVALEELFFNNNVTTAINVAQARGVILLTAVKECGGKLFEYTPLQIKQALTGYGRAEKRQIQEMTKTFLGLAKIPKPDDAADALAVALTHSQTSSRFSQGFKIR